MFMCPHCSGWPVRWRMTAGRCLRRYAGRMCGGLMCAACQRCQTCKKRTEEEQEAAV